MVAVIFEDWVEPFCSRSFESGSRVLNSFHNFVWCEGDWEVIVKVRAYVKEVFLDFVWVPIELFWMRWPDGFSDLSFWQCNIVHGRRVHWWVTRWCTLQLLYSCLESADNGGLIVDYGPVMDSLVRQGTHSRVYLLHPGQGFFRG
jgi:hypothetical protein